MTTLAKLIVQLDADSARLQTKLDSSEKRLKRWESNASRSVSKVKKAFVNLAAAYVGFSAVKNAINIHRQFGAAISDLAAITGAAGKDLDYLREKSKEFGKTTTLSASQAAEAFKLVASAKPDLLENAKALAVVTKEAISLAEASGSTLPDAARTLGSSLNQFGADADQASRFINVLAAGAKYGASEIEDTALALKDSGLVAASAGSSFEELNAAIQAMSTVSLKGAEAGTGLRNVYLNLAIQSKREYKPAVVGLTAAINNLKKAHLSDTELLEIFGKKNIVAAKALISQAHVLTELNTKLKGTNTAYEQAAIKVDNLDGDIKKMNSSWEGTTILLGEKFNPALRAASQGITWLAKVASSVVLAIDDLGNAIGAYAAASVTALSFDFTNAERILELRDQEREKNEKALAAIWGKVEAVNALTVAEKNRNDANENRTSYLEQTKEEKERLIELEISHAEKLRAIYEKDARERIKREREVQDQITTMRGNAWQSAANFLRLYAGESKEAAIAVIAIEKGLAIAQIIQHKGVAIVAALKLPPIAKEAAIAQIETISAVQIGLVAATGLVQASQVGGGGAGGGTYANPTYTQTPADSNATDQGNQQGGITYVNIDGYGVSEEGIDALIDQIYDATERRDKIIISRNSRNRDELVA